MHYQLFSCLDICDEKKMTLDIIVLIWFRFEYLLNIKNPMCYALVCKHLQETMCLLTGCGQQKTNPKTSTRRWRSPKSCKHLLFVVVVLCSGNKKLTKNNKNAAFHSHRSAAFLSVVFSLLAVAIATPLSGRYASVIGRAAHATLRS